LNTVFFYKYADSTKLELSGNKPENLEDTHCWAQRDIALVFLKVGPSRPGLLTENRLSCALPSWVCGNCRISLCTAHARRKIIIFSIHPGLAALRPGLFYYAAPRLTLTLLFFFILLTRFYFVENMGLLRVRGKVK